MDRALMLPRSVPTESALPLLPHHPHVDLPERDHDILGIRRSRGRFRHRRLVFVSDVALASASVARVLILTQPRIVLFAGALCRRG